MKMSMNDPQVIFKNDDLVALNKPAGLMVHAVKVSPGRRLDPERAAEPTLADWIVARYPETKHVGDDPVLRPGIVHRLDKATSGVIIVARTQEMFERLKRLFQEHRMAKTYVALVHGVPRERHGVIDAPIGILSGTLKRSIHSAKMAKEAVTEYAVERTMEGPHGEPCALVRVMPKTGRTHQIRVHLASIGHPIVGDPLYGKKHDGAARLMLHAAGISFSDGNGHTFDFEAPLPSDFTYPQE